MVSLLLQWAGDKDAVAAESVYSVIETDSGSLVIKTNAKVQCVTF